MDLNYLYYREQVSMMRADAASCEKSRESHLGLAECYGKAISRLRSMMRDAKPFPSNPELRLL